MTRKPKSTPPAVSKKRTSHGKPVKPAVLKKAAAPTMRDRKAAGAQKVAEAPSKSADTVSEIAAAATAAAPLEPVAATRHGETAARAESSAAHNEAHRSRAGARAGGTEAHEGSHHAHESSSHAAEKHAVEKGPEKVAEKVAEKKVLGVERRVSAMSEDHQSQIKLLIARGKEQGYLTYAQVNDHLPSEIVDPEQIEDIVNRINDIGIPVYEKAPDTESLLATEPAAPADEEAIEEAAAALAALDSELGRTTDPVRMYMREMGTVELLTREGEIRIAKRIEEGLEAVKVALGSYPGTYELLLRQYEAVKAGQMRLVDVIVGFVDPNAPDEIAQPQNPKMMALEREEAANDDEEGDGEEEEEALDTGPDPEEAAKRFASIGKIYHQYLNALDKLGSKDPKTQKIRKKICGELMELKLSPKMFDQLIDNLRQHVTEVRLLEKEIMFLCIKQAGMP